MLFILFIFLKFLTKLKFVYKLYFFTMSFTKIIKLTVHNNQTKCSFTFIQECIMVIVEKEEDTMNTESNSLKSENNNSSIRKYYKNTLV